MPFCKMDAPIVVLLLAFLSVFGRCEPSEDCQDVESSGRARLLLDNVGEGDWVDGYKLGDLAEPTKCAFEAPNVDLIRLALLSALCFVEALWFNGTEEDNVETLLGKDVKSTIGRLRCAEPSKMCLISSAGRKGTEMYKPRTGREEIHLVPFCKIEIENLLVQNSLSTEDYPRFKSKSSARMEVYEPKLAISCDLAVQFWNKALIGLEGTGSTG
uniref:NTR domain-containing protein n=1 Tax=Steinernema glaseri TaxID=37863 RepID=A0A1I7ZEB7_9BILA